MTDLDSASQFEGARAVWCWVAGAHFGDVLDAVGLKVAAVHQIEDVLFFLVGPGHPGGA
ncbi:unannotated protein [freshwater metagenome]|uniref:Unannotated protein n=1 Tax=freshwater metagenome TaxID=449393 RepID=A0A6J7KFV4_9ZZZZ